MANEKLTNGPNVVVIASPDGEAEFVNLFQKGATPTQVDYRLDLGPGHLSAARECLSQTGRPSRIQIASIAMYDPSTMM